MRLEDLRPDQQERLNNGCWYEVARTVCTLLIIAIIIYILPLLGPAAPAATAILNILGMLFIARWVTGILYPGDPFKKLVNELKEEE